MERPSNADNEGSQSAEEPILWQAHTDRVTKAARQIAKALKLPDELQEAIRLAAQFHDLGKKREVWQRSIGNPNPKNWLAKSGRKMKAVELTDYRYEFGSVLDLQNEPEFQKQSEDQKSLILHLIAASHGRGRPHFPRNEAFDPKASARLWNEASQEVPGRFVRLQRKYGRWGLAYLEALLRAADYAASVNPSTLVEEQQKELS